MGTKTKKIRNLHAVITAKARSMFEIVRRARPLALPEKIEGAHI